MNIAPINNQADRCGHYSRQPIPGLWRNCRRTLPGAVRKVVLAHSVRNGQRNFTNAGSIPASSIGDVIPRKEYVVSLPYLACAVWGTLHKKTM